MKTGTGSRPGDNLADVCFSFIFARVLSDIRHEVKQAGHLPVVPWSEGMLCSLQPVEPGLHTKEALDATWMDDATFLVVADTAAALPGAMATTGKAVLDACVSRALLPNVDRGKTELIAHVVGAGSRGVRKDLFSLPDASLAIPCKLWEGASIRLVPTYQHLGGFIHHDASLVRELRHRVGAAWKAFNTRKKRVFGSPTVSLRDKAILYESLILSILLHGAGSWRALTPAELSILEQAHFGMAFFMVRPLHTHEEALRLGGRQVLAILRLPTVETLLHVARLRHLLSCIRAPVPVFWAILHWQGGWLQACRRSLEWMWEHVDRGESTLSWQASWQTWQELCLQQPRRWKSLVRKAQVQAVTQESCQVAMRRHLGLVCRQLRCAGATLPGIMASDRHHVHFCAPCSQLFQTYQAWSVHAFKVHGHVTEGRKIQGGTQCQSCLRHFSTHVKLCRHLNHSRACRLHLHEAGLSCQAEPGQGSRKAPDEGKFQAPSLQAQGPILSHGAGAWSEYLDRPSAEVMDCLAVLDSGLSLTQLSREEAWERARLAFGCVCLPVRKVLATASSWKQAVLAGTMQSTFAPSLLCEIADWIQEADLAAWLVPSPISKPPAYTTFRDASLILDFLDTASISVPVTFSVLDSTLVCVGTGSWASSLGSLGPNSLSFTHEECLRSLHEGTVPSFFEGPFHDTVFLISVLGLPSWQDLPTAPVRPKALFQKLSRAILACDLFRLALRLWLSGTPTAFFFSSHDRIAPQPVRSLHLLDLVQSRGACCLRSRGADWEHLPVSPFN